MEMSEQVLNHSCGPQPTADVPSSHVPQELAKMLMNKKRVQKIVRIKIKAYR